MQACAFPLTVIVKICSIFCFMFLYILFFVFENITIFDLFVKK